MAGFQTLEMPRPRFSNGIPAAPLVSIHLVRPLEASVAVNGVNGLAQSCPALVKQIRLHRSEGKSLRWIATKLHTTQKNVFDHTRDIPPPPEGWAKGNAPCVFNEAKAQRMRRAGFSYAEIGREFGYGRTAMRDRLRKLQGIERPSPKNKRKPETRAVEWAREVTGFTLTELSRCSESGACDDRAIVVKARHLVFWLLCRRVGLSTQAAGNYLGGFDRTTVQHGIGRVEAAAASLGIDLGGSRTRALRKLWVGVWPARKAA